MIITPFQVAQTFVGIKELNGDANNPLIVAMIQTCQPDASNDEIPWCSAFINFISKMLKLPRSHSLAAKSNLAIGTVINLDEATADADIVILNRTENPALGHVGFFAGKENGSDGFQYIYILGGNQSNSVSIQRFRADKVAGVRRLI